MQKMHITNLFIFTIFLFFVYFNQCLVNAEVLSKECEELGYSLETSFRYFVLMDKKSIIPNDEKAMEMYCKKAKAIPKRMKQFKKCVNKFSQQVINLISPNLAKTIRKMCITDRKDALKSLKCLKPKHKVVMSKCFDRYSHQLKYAAHSMNSIQKMLPLICCGYLETKQCVQSKLSGICKTNSNDSKSVDGSSKTNITDTGAYMSSFADALGKEMIGFACSRHSNWDECVKKQVHEQLDMAVSQKFPQYEKEFIMMPFIRASERMMRKASTDASLDEKKQGKAVQ